MSKPPAFLFYPADFLQGTWDFTNEEKGAYVLLLCFQWDKGFIPNNIKTIKKIAGISPKKLEKILKKFEKTDVGFVNKRMELEREKYLKIVEKRKDAANERWSKVNAKASVDVDASAYPNGMHPIQSNSILTKEKEKDKKESEGVTPPSPPPKKKIFKYDLEFLNAQENQPYKKCFMDWLQYKKERRENYKSQKTLETALEGLKKLSENNPQTAERIVLNSITSNIQGLYPLKNGNNKTSTGMATKATGINYDE